MSLPKEPRQKMINIMYLVLTALLALNVSKQILDAFVVVNNGLILTNKNFDAKNQTTYNQLEKAMANDRAKTKPFYDKAMLIQGWSRALCNYIDTLKIEIVKETEGIPQKVADTLPLAGVEKGDNFDMPTHVLVNDAAAEDGHLGKAHTLKMKMADYRKKVMALCKPEDTAALAIGLKTPDQFSKTEGKKVNWEIDNFAERPLDASVVLLTKFQNDIKNTEATIIQYLLGGINANDFKVSGFEPEVIANSNYVLLGDSFRAKLFVSAVSNTQQPRIYVGDVDSVTGLFSKGGHIDSVKVKGGTGFYNVRADKEGPTKFYGTINVRAPDGTVKRYPFHSSYLVAKPAVVISPTAMNVFYCGVDNPVEISAPGFADEDIRPNFQGSGSISGSHGKYTVRVSGANNSICHISVSAKKSDGSNQNFPAQEFRIKKIPDPVCYVLNQKGDIHVTKAALSVSQGVQARLENFDFKLDYNVTSFEFVASANGVSKTIMAQGASFTQEMKTLMSKLSPGSHITIQNVHAKSITDTRTIPGCNIILM